MIDFFVPSSKNCLTTTTGAIPSLEQTRQPVSIPKRIQISVMCSFCATEGTTVCFPYFLFLHNLHCFIFLPTVRVFWFSYVCLGLYMWGQYSFLSGCKHRHTGRFLSNIAPQLFSLSLSFSITTALSPWMRGLFGFSSGFPLFTITLVLLFIFWPGHKTLQRKWFLTGRDGGGMTN